MLLQGGCEDNTCRDLDRKSVGKLVEAPKCMTMGPSILHELFLSPDQTDLYVGFSLAGEVLSHITDVAGDVDKARSSDRYDSVDWWRLDVHDLGFEPRLIWTPTTVTPLLRWLSTTRTRLTSSRRLS